MASLIFSAIARDSVLRVRSMSSVSAALVKKLREMSNAPMMECKKALEDNTVNGDIDKAFEFLRRQGIASASKKQGRSAADGLVSLKIAGNRAAILEINSETDFVARNQIFQDLVANLTNTVLSHKPSAEAEAEAKQQGLALDIDKLMDHSIITDNSEKVGISVKEALAEGISTLRENIVLRRAKLIVSPPNGVLGSYVHGAVASGMGRAAAIVSLGHPTNPATNPTTSAAASEADTARLVEVGNELAMHIVAARPRYLNATAVPAGVLEQERSIVLDQMGEDPKLVGKVNEYRDLLAERAATATATATATAATATAAESSSGDSNDVGSGSKGGKGGKGGAVKGVELTEKIVEGKLRKWMAEVCLLDQPHMIVEKSPPVHKYLKSALPPSWSVVEYCRYEIGEEGPGKGGQEG